MLSKIFTDYFLALREGIEIVLFHSFLIGILMMLVAILFFPQFVKNLSDGLWNSRAVGVVFFFVIAFVMVNFRLFIHAALHRMHK